MFADFKDILTEVLQNYGFWICIVIVFAITFLIVVIALQIAKDHAKKPTKVDNNAFFTALGGKENIKEISLKGSRLSVTLNNDELMDREKLKEVGVTSIIKMSDHYVLVVSEIKEDLKLD